jgi:secondary thiamine-phosphate synthase enzyme
MFFRETIKLKTKKDECIDITDRVQQIVRKSGVNEGICNIFCPATTCGLITNENELMLISDFKRFFGQILPEQKVYQHASNGHSHLRAGLINQSLTFPVSNQSLVLGQWQSILFFEFDIKPRDRQIIITILSA